MLITEKYQIFNRSGRDFSNLHGELRASETFQRPCLLATDTGIISLQTNAMRPKCAICGTLWQLWLPLASWLAARNLLSLRFDTEMLTILVRRFLRMVPHNPSNNLMAYQTLMPECCWICRFLPPPPKWTVRIAASSLPRQQIWPSRLSVESSVWSNNTWFGELFCWLLTAGCWLLAAD